MYGRRDEKGGGLSPSEPVAARGLVSGGTTSEAQWGDERSEGVRRGAAHARNLMMSWGELKAGRRDEDKKKDRQINCRS